MTSAQLSSDPNRVVAWHVRASTLLNRGTKCQSRPGLCRGALLIEIVKLYITAHSHNHNREIAAITRRSCSWRKGLTAISVEQ